MSGSRPATREHSPSSTRHVATDDAPPKPALSENLALCQRVLKSVITRTVKNATIKLDRASIFLEDPHSKRDKREIREIVKLHKDMVTVLGMIETDQHFHSYVDSFKTPLTGKEKLTLCAVASSHLDYRKRIEVVVLLKAAIDGLTDNLRNNEVPTESPSEEDIVNVSVEIEKTFLEEQVVLDDLNNIDDVLQIMSSFEDDDDKSERDEDRYIPVLPLPVKEEENGFSDPPIADAPIPVGPRELTLGQGDTEHTTTNGRSSTICPCCAGNHALHQCLDQGLKRYCALNDLCIYCTASKHISRDCPLRVDLPVPSESSEAAQPGQRRTLFNNSSTSIAQNFNPSDISTYIQENKKELARMVISEAARKSIPQPEFDASDEDDLGVLFGCGDNQGMSYREVDTVLAEFNGDPVKFTYFSSLFESMVMKNRRLSDAFRYALLEKKLVGKAKRYLVQLDSFSESIKETFKALKLLFGSDVSAVNETLRKFQQLLFSETDFKEALSQISECSGLICQLRQFGEDTESKAFIRSLNGKFPVAFARELYSLYEITDNNPSTKQILNFYQAYLLENTFEEKLQPLRSSKDRISELPSESVMVATVPNSSGSTSRAPSGAHNNSFGTRPGAFQEPPASPAGSALGSRGIQGASCTASAPDTIAVTDSSNLCQSWSSLDECGSSLPAFLHSFESECVFNTSTPDTDLGEVPKLPFVALNTIAGHTLLALVDSGSTISVIAHRSAEKIGLKVKATTLMTVTGYHDTQTMKSNIYQVGLETDKNPFAMNLLGAPRLPPVVFACPRFDPNDLRFLHDRRIDIEKLAQARSLNGHSIDMIVGTDLLPHLLGPSIRHLLPSGRLLEMTPFAPIVFPAPRCAAELSMTNVDDISEEYHQPVSQLIPVDIADDFVLARVPTSTSARTLQHHAEFDEVLARRWDLWLTACLGFLRGNVYKDKRSSTLSPFIGQVALIYTEKLQRSHWPIGVIVSLHSSSSGAIQNATIRCGSTEVNRAVNQLVPLEIEGVSPSEVNAGKHPDRTNKFLVPPDFPQIATIPQNSSIRSKTRNKKADDNSEGVPRLMAESENEGSLEMDKSSANSESGPQSTQNAVLGDAEKRLPDSRDRPFLSQKAKDKPVSFATVAHACEFSTPRSVVSCRVILPHSSQGTPISRLKELFLNEY